MTNKFRISNRNIILSFDGILTAQKMEELMVETEAKLNSNSSDVKIIKRTFAIFIEFLQNLFHHAAEAPDPASRSKIVEIELFQDSFNYYVQTGNYIQNDNIQPLKKWINQINGYSSQEIKTFYKHILQHADFSEKGGANLGIIDVARKAKSNLNYHIEHITNETSYLSLQIPVSYNTFNSKRIKRTKSTPEINFNPNTGKLQLEGRSIPEDAYTFYHPLMEWLNTYIYLATSRTTLEVHIEYMNTSSSKYFIEILNKLQNIAYWDNRKVNVRWYYELEDVDMFETGKDFQDLSDVPFEIIEKE